MKVIFRSVDEFEGWYKFPGFIEEIIVTQQVKRVCEIGAGATPALADEAIRRHGLTFHAVDEAEGELQKSGRQETSIYDVCQPASPVPGAPYDLVFSRMTAEHFRDPQHAYQNMLQALVPGGLSVHCFATLYALPFVVNRLLPDNVTDFLWSHFAPRDRERHDKFKAYYSHCRGPIESQLRFFQSLGYEILEYRGYFGHNYYEPRLPLLHRVHRYTANFLLKVPVAFLTTYATVILRRPVTATV